MRETVPPQVGAEAVGADQVTCDNLRRGSGTKMICGVAISDISRAKSWGSSRTAAPPLVCDACVTTPSLLTATSALPFSRVRACFESVRPWGLYPQSAVTNPSDRDSMPRH